MSRWDSHSYPVTRYMSIRNDLDLVDSNMDDDVNEMAVFTNKGIPLPLALIGESIEIESLLIVSVTSLTTVDCIEMLLN